MARSDNGEEEIDIRVRRGGRDSPPPPPAEFVERWARENPGTYRRVPPIYPRRPLRRSSTRPVRFEDEEVEIVRRRDTRYSDERADAFRSPSRTARPINYSSRGYDTTYESDSSSDRRSRNRPFRYDDAVRERERVVVEEEYGGGRRSRSPSPPIVIHNVFGRERSRSPNDLDDLDFERERSQRISRSMRYEPSIYGQRSRYDHDDEDVGWEKDAYSFRLSRHTKSLLSRESTLGSVSDISEDNEPPPPPPEDALLKSSQPGNLLMVSRSKYTGEGSIGGLQSAEIQLMSSSNLSSRKGAQPIFRWFQFEDLSMNFDRFEGSCHNIAGLTHSQRVGINRVLGRVRRKADKPCQVAGANKVRFMVPGILQELMPKDASDPNGKQKTITWMCLPYFCLQKYTNFSGLLPSAHPVRTLLQARFSLTRKERDMQQAVCQLPGTPKDHCYHIAQTWCLILGDDLLVTCSASPLTTDSVAGRENLPASRQAPSATSIRPLSKALQINPPNVGTSNDQRHRSRPSNIIVSCGQLQWCLPIEESKTYFALVSHFWEFWPRRLQFTFQGTTVSPEAWPKIIERASKTLVRLDLNTRPDIRERPRGILIYSSPNPSPPVFEEPEEITPDAPRPAERDLASPAPENDTQDPASGEKSYEASALHPDAAKAETVGNSKGKEEPSALMGFHVFTWLNTQQPTSWSGSTVIENAEKMSPSDAGLLFNEARLREDLEEIDDFLQHKIGFQERLLYQECPVYTRMDIYTYLERAREKMTAREHHSDVRRRKIYEDQVELVNKAETLFQVFLPSDYDGPTVRKFWGALRVLFEFQQIFTWDALLIYLPSQYIDKARHQENPRRGPILASDTVSVIRWLGFATPIATLFKEFLSQADVLDRINIEIPEELPKAWLHLLMTLITAPRENNMQLFEEQSIICNQILDEGMRKVVLSMKHKSLLEYAVFKPWEVVSLINYELLADITAQLDTSDTYFEYLTSLASLRAEQYNSANRNQENEIETNPLDRGHQDKITNFKQEVSVILGTLQEQQKTLDFAQPIPGNTPRSSDIFKGAGESRPYFGYERAYPSNMADDARSKSRARHTYGISRLKARPGSLGPRLDATDPIGVLGLLIQDSQALIDRKIREFQEMDGRASELEAWNIQKIDYNKDRQEAAIYAFTIVTIIFLPLSTVAGIMGMNTNDIRNMEVTQWVFWTVAIPLAVIIIVLCLIWAGELENVWKGFRNLWKRNKGTFEVSLGSDVTLTAVERLGKPTLVYNDYEKSRPAKSDRPLYGRRSNTRSVYDD